MKKGKGRVASSVFQTIRKSFVLKKEKTDKLLTKSIGFYDFELKGNPYSDTTSNGISTVTSL